jgi:hypothetical protein
MRVNIILTAATLFVLTSAIHAQKIVIDVDKASDFTKFKSFSWAEGQIATNPSTGQLIVVAVERELNSRGLVRNDTSPDIRIAAMAAADMDLQGVGPSWNNERYKSWGGYNNQSALINVAKGMLMIDLIETKNKFSIWRGVVKNVFVAQPTGNPEKDVSQMQSLVNKTVGKMFKKYPVNLNKR